MGGGIKRSRRADVVDDDATRHEVRQRRRLPSHMRVSFVRSPWLGPFLGWRSSTRCYRSQIDGDGVDPFVGPGGGASHSGRLSALPDVAPMVLPCDVADQALFHFVRASRDPGDFLLGLVAGSIRLFPSSFYTFLPPIA